VRKSHNPQVRSLEVKRRFEPSHVAAVCLAQAYERLVPILRRPVSTRQSRPSLSDILDEQRKEGRRS
jgi:hypothetical protein